MTVTDQELGAQVKLARKGLGWGQARLAKYVGVKQATVSRVETGLGHSFLVGRAFRDFLSRVESGDLKPDEPAGQ